MQSYAEKPNPNGTNYTVSVSAGHVRWFNNDVIKGIPNNRDLQITYEIGVLNTTRLFRISSSSQYTTWSNYISTIEKEYEITEFSTNSRVNNYIKKRLKTMIDRQKDLVYQAYLKGIADNPVVVHGFMPAVYIKGTRFSFKKYTAHIKSNKVRNVKFSLKIVPYTDQLLGISFEGAP